MTSYPRQKQKVKNLVRAQELSERTAQPKTHSSGIPKIIQRFLNRHVTVKAAEFTIEGKLRSVDQNQAHYQPIGNLILEDGSIVRGNLVEAIHMKRTDPK